MNVYTSPSPIYVLGNVALLSLHHLRQPVDVPLEARRAPPYHGPPDAPHVLQNAQVLAAGAQKDRLRHVDNHLVHVGEGPGRRLPGEQHVAVQPDDEAEPADPRDGRRLSDGGVVLPQAGKGRQEGRVREEGVFGVEQRPGLGVDLARGAEDGCVDEPPVSAVPRVRRQQEEERVDLETELEGQAEQVAMALRRGGAVGHGGRSLSCLLLLICV